MTIIESIIFGIVQGVTEFLPISSSGHLAILENLFKKDFNVMSYNIALHIASLVAVCIIFRRDIWEMIKHPFSKLTLLVVTGTVPTLVMGILFNDLFEKIFNSSVTLGFEFILTGLILYYADSIKSRGKELDKMTFKDAVLVGIAQGIAILPAVSRSGLTIAGGLFRGLDRKFALKFSFLMSIPAILAAGAKDGYDVIKAGGLSNLGVDTWVLAAGMLAAGVAGYLAIRFMIKIFTNVSFKVFSYYVFALGGLIIIDQMFFHVLFGRLW
jgi:undecaprenyl-diphosphatase